MLKIINEFATKSFSEINLRQVVEKVNSYSPTRSEEAIKNIMAFFAIDLIEAPWRQTNYPKQLLEQRGLKPLLARLKNDTYQLLFVDKSIGKKIARKQL